MQPLYTARRGYAALCATTAPNRANARRDTHPHIRQTAYSRNVPLRAQDDRFPRPRRLCDPAAALCTAARRGFAGIRPPLCRKPAKIVFRYCAYATRTPRKNGSLSSALSIGFAPLRNSCGTNRRVLRICRRRRKFPHEHARRAPVFRLYFTIYGGKSKPLFPKRQTFKQILICAASAAPDARQMAKDRSSLFPAARPLPADTLTKRHIGRAACRYCVRRTGKAPYKARLSESVR